MKMTVTCNGVPIGHALYTPIDVRPYFHWLTRPIAGWPFPCVWGKYTAHDGVSLLLDGPPPTGAHYVVQYTVDL